MADPNELFHILNAGSGAGSSPNQGVDGVTAAAGLLGLIGFSFKDSAGNLVLPQLTSDGKVKVDSEAFSGTPFKANGELAAGSLTLALVTGCDITISLTKIYSRFGWIVSCRHAALFQMVYVDDAGGTPTETVIGEAIVGPGQYTFSAVIPDWFLDTTGGTGTQKIQLKAKNFEVLSSLRGVISFFEQNAL